MTTTIIYEMGGRRMRWEIEAHPSDDDNTTLKEHLLDWYGPDAIFVEAYYTEDGKQWMYK
jgi:hypothetical protein